MDKNTDPTQDDSVIALDSGLYEAYCAAHEGRASAFQTKILEHLVWTVFDPTKGPPRDVEFADVVAEGLWDKVVNPPWFFRSKEELLSQDALVEALRRLDEQALVLALQHVAPHRLKKKSGPPPGLLRGRSIKSRDGGPWTPQILSIELRRLGISESELAREIGIARTNVNKWIKRAIPDERQEQITTALSVIQYRKRSQS